MGEKIVVGPVNRGLRNDRTAFVIDNDSFPTLENAFQWRGRVKRKRGTRQLGRLTRYFDSTILAFYPQGTATTSTQTLSAGGAGNLLSGFANSGILTVAPNASVIPGSVTITDTTTARVYTDPLRNGTLTGTSGGGGTINYATGAFTITPAAADTITANFKYFDALPVMGLEDFTSPTSQFPGTIAFDTVYSYNINTTSPYAIFSVSFYKNPSTGTYTGYTQKAIWSPVNWNGEDYQQFWTTNYQGAMWATNGIEVPFDITNIGMQFKPILTTTIVAAGPPARVTLQITAHGLVVGDFVFVNEVLTTTGINFETGYVDTVTDANNVIVTFLTATVANNGIGGIAQYLTKSADPTKDCIRFYDGAPINNGTPPVFQTNAGWVNFCPPLLSGPTTIFSVSDLPPAQYYLVGARVILQFKDRLLFFGPVVQTSSPGSQKYLQDTVIYSQNGTPYYTCTFPYDTVTPTASVLATAVFTPILIPVNQTSAPNAFFEDVDGFGGFIQAGYDQPITTVSSNEDVLIIGFTGRQARFVYTGNDIIPFNFFIINSEYGSSSTFSVINLDRGIITVGPNGIIITSQVSAERIDLEIPDDIFQFNLTNNGIQRVCAQRDFINEWVFFTYSSADNDQDTKFPNQTLFYNYRDNSWAIFKEDYTHYGTFRAVSGLTWDDLTDFTWDQWTELWDSGESTLLQPEIIAGNQQGFVMFKDEGTGEDPSGYMVSIDANSLVTSPNHGLNGDDFIIITGALGTIGTYVNGKIFSVQNPSTNTFTLNPTVPTGTYLGGGVFTRLYIPTIQTKQFPVAWAMARKTRIGPQQYLFSTTSIGQITLLIFLSQNGANAYNSGVIVPNPLSQNNALVYSSILYTCPESENIGLTPANVNLQTPLADNQAQIWHRMNTSLIGDTVQLGFTLSQEQMRLLSQTGLALAITGATKATSCVLTCTNTLEIGQQVLIQNVGGMIELNNNIYLITAVSPTTLTLNVDSTGFTTYTSGGTATPVAPVIQTSEIELHCMILDVQPSQMLV